MDDIIEAENLFRKWFVDPIVKLKELPDGDGGFIAFISGLALYERLIIARLKSRNQSTEPEKVKLEMAHDLGLTSKERAIFWDMFRNGLLHHAMPKAGRTSWIFHHTFSERPVFKSLNGISVVCIDPWKFTERVLKEFLTNPSLIVMSDSFPLPVISPIPFNQLS